MSLELPAKPNLEHLKNQAKDLLQRSREGDAAAIERCRAHVKFKSPETLKLADAQHVIARDYGFATWSKLREHVESLTRELPPAEMLSAAVRRSDAGKVAQILDANPGLKARLNEPMANYGDSGMQPILAAVQRSDRGTIDVLLKAGADIDARSHGAARGVGVLDECGPDFASFLMERGATLDAHSASRLGMLDELRGFVAADPTVVGARGANGQSVLHFATTIEIADYLLNHGADIDARDLLHDSTPAQHMLRVVQARHYPRDRQDIARYLVARGCRTDILMAAALGDLQLVRRHLDADPACIRTRTTPGSVYFENLGPKKTPHLVARDFSHEDVFRLLMDRSPEDVKLSQACELGDEAAFRDLLARRRNLADTLTDDDRRQLPDAAQSNNTHAVRLMLAAGWPADATGEYNLTALQWASWHGNAVMVREILRYHPQKIELRSVLNGSENSWHRDTGDYGAVMEVLIEAGAIPPKLTDDLEASQAIRDVLRCYEETQAKG